MFFSLDEFIDAGDARALRSGDELEFAVIDRSAGAALVGSEQQQQQQQRRSHAPTPRLQAVRLRLLPRGSVSFVSDVSFGFVVWRLLLLTSSATIGCRFICRHCATRRGARRQQRFGVGRCIHRRQSRKVSFFASSKTSSFINILL
jgi:hypothetical protein